MKFFRLSILIILLTGSVPVSAESSPAKPEADQPYTGISAYYSDFIRYQPGPLFPTPESTESPTRSGLFTFHEERKPDIDLFNLLMTGLAVGGAVVMASGGGGGSSGSSSAAPSPPPTPPVLPPTPPPIAPTSDCTTTAGNPQCPPPLQVTLVTDVKDPAPANANLSVVTATILENGVRREATLTLAPQSTVRFDVSNNKNVTLEQINREVVYTLTNGLTMTTTLVVRETITLDSRETPITSTLDTPEINPIFGTANLTVKDQSSALTLGTNVTVIDCRLSNGIAVTVTTTVNAQQQGVSTTLYNVNGTLDARPYIFRDGHFQGNQEPYRHVNINFKTNQFKTTWVRYRIPGCSQRDNDCYGRRPVRTRITVLLHNNDLNRDDQAIPKYWYLYYLGGTVRTSFVHNLDNSDRDRTYYHYHTGTGSLVNQQITRYNINIERVTRELRGEPLMLSHTPITDPKILASHIGFHSDKQTWFGAGDFRVLDDNKNPVYTTEFRSSGGGGSGPVVFYLTNVQDYHDVLPDERDNHGLPRGYRFSFPVIENGERRRSCILRPRGADPSRGQTGTGRDNSGEYFVDISGTRRYKLSPFTESDNLLSYAEHVELMTVKFQNFSFGHDQSFNNIEFSYQTEPITLKGLAVATERGFRKIRNSNSNISFNKVNVHYDWPTTPRAEAGRRAPNFTARWRGEYTNGTIQSNVFRSAFLEGYYWGLDAYYPGISPKDKFSLGVQRKLSAAPAAQREVKWQYDLNYENKSIYFNFVRELNQGVTKAALGYREKF